MNSNSKSKKKRHKRRSFAGDAIIKPKRKHETETERADAVTVEITSIIVAEMIKNAIGSAEAEAEADRASFVSWMENFNRLRFLSTTNTSVLPDLGDDNCLGRWVKFQRRSYGQGNLRNHRIVLLESIGFKWRSDIHRGESEPLELFSR